MLKIIIKDRFYIPAHAVDKQALKDHFELQFNDKKDCRPNCKLARIAERQCSTCPSDGILKMWQLIVTKNGNSYIAVPNGDSTLLGKIISRKYEFVDRRPNVPMKHNLEWTGRLRRGEKNAKGEKLPNQKQMLSAWRKHVATGETGGTIASPARSGKCVAKGTMIRTEKGYQLIEDLFDCIEHDQIGNFGNICVPEGVASIRGLHKRYSDEMIKFTLANGVQLTVTPEHPLVLTAGDKQFWQKAEFINKNDSLAIYPTFDPIFDPIVDEGFGVAQAGLMGHILACTDLQYLLDTTIVHLHEIQTEYAKFEAFAELFEHVFERKLTNDCKFYINRTALKGWQSKLLASTDTAWHAFICALFSANEDKIPFVVLPTLLARALHFHLITHGVEAKIDDNKVSILKRNELKIYSDSFRVDHALKVKVSKIEVIKERQIVYDLMILPNHSFITDGVASHNTVIGVAGALSKEQRTLITASKRRFLVQFAMRFGELTNVKQFYDRGRYPVVFVDPKKWSEGPKYGIKVVTKWDNLIDKADVILSTYQQFISDNGKLRLKKYISGKIGTLIGDEIHQAAADCFSRVINRSNVRYRMGLTATTIRKDKLEKITEAIIGKTVIVGKVTSTLPRLRLLETGVVGNSYKQWAAMVSFLVKHEERNRIILRYVFRVLRENPKHSIVLPVTRVQHNHDLVRMINQQADYCRRAKNEDWPEDLAMGYHGKADTDKVLKSVNSGKTRVTVATYDMIKYGIDIPRWTHVLLGIVPTSNAANMYQAFNRICTPYPEELEAKLKDKPQPIATIMIDQMSVSIFCFVKLWNDINYGLKAALSGDNFFETKLAVAGPKTQKRMQDIVFYPKSYNAEDVGVKLIGGKSKIGRKKRFKTLWQSRGGITKL